MDTPEPKSINWKRLRDLRDLFLSGEPIPDPYWTDQKLLADYDATLGERIAWKWRAVLKELSMRGWTPPSDRIYDLGCGSGVASRTFLESFGDAIKHASIYDHSPQAMDYTAKALREQYPELHVREGQEDDKLGGVVLISHVLTELPDDVIEELVERLVRADAVIWVEPGTFESSRLLIHLREALRDRFTVLAPCPHQGECGLLQEENENHWCHHFAPSPSGVHQSTFWGRFRKEMNLDLNAVAYSFLVLGKGASPASEIPDLSHTIGKPLFAPKFLRLLSCQEEDVAELVASRRSGSELYKHIKKSNDPGLYQFERRKNRITGGVPLAGQSSEEKG